MDLLRFLYIMEKMLTANGHFIAWLRINEPLSKPADGWLITSQTGERFLVTCRQLTETEAVDVALRAIVTDEGEVEWGVEIDPALIKETTSS